jgi:hypothetical protein
MKDKATLEWAAQWIEDSLKGESNERVIQFGKNIAMTLRAAGLGQPSTPSVAVGAQLPDRGMSDGNSPESSELSASISAQARQAAEKIVFYKFSNDPAQDVLSIAAIIIDSLAGACQKGVEDAAKDDQGEG